MVGTAAILDGQMVGTAAINAQGVATLSNVTFRPGVHNLLATYPGQGLFAPAQSIVLIVNIDQYPVTLTMSSSANPALLGQPVNITITSSCPGDPGFIPSPVKLTLNNNTVLATLTPNAGGVSTFTTSSLSLGYNQLTASAPGDTSHLASTGYLSQQIVNGYSTPQRRSPPR